MGRSITALPSTVADVAGAAVRHPRTGVRYTVAPAASGRLRFTDEAATMSREAAWAVGSGAHTQSYFFAEADGLFQLPLTWYARPKKWDLSPGYQGADHPGFFREARADCIACHGEPLVPQAGTRARFLDATPRAIGCGRCHGDARAHVAAASGQGPAAPSPVVPTKLDPARARDVCDQCHLQGAVRLLREGRAFGDFLPGQRLSDSVAVFVHARPGEGFGIASHGERLRRSACAQASGDRLGCTTCHSPHRTGPARDRAAPCRDCHGGAAGAHACSGPGGDDCVRCHMTKGETSDIPHTAMTDHFIRRRPDAPPATGDPGPLVWVARPDPDPRDPAERLLLGRAWAERTRLGGPPPAVEAARLRALQLLTDGLAVLPDSVEGWLDRAAMAHLGGDAAGARAAAEHAFRRRPAHAKVAAVAASARLAAGDADAALTAVDAALAAEPGAPDLRVQRAQVLMSLARFDEAGAELALVLRERPSDGDARLAAGLVAQFRAGAAEALPHFQSAARFAPARVGAWLALLRAEVLLGRWDAALATAERARPFLTEAMGGTLPASAAGILDGARARALLGLGRGAEALALARAALAASPAAAEAAVVLALDELAAGRPAAAAASLEAALERAPDAAIAWAALALARRAEGREADAEQAARRARLFGARP